MNENVRLYGEPDAERLYTDFGAAHEAWWDGCNLEPGDARFPFTVTFHEYTVHEPGDTGDTRIPSGADMADRIADDFMSDCLFEELGDDYDRAARDPEVIAAFDRAREALVRHQRFFVADRAVRSCVMTFTASDDDHIPTYTVTEWTDL